MKNGEPGSAKRRAEFEKRENEREAKEKKKQPLALRSQARDSLIERNCSKSLPPFFPSHLLLTIYFVEYEAIIDVVPIKREKNMKISVNKKKVNYFQF